MTRRDHLKLIGAGAVTLPIPAFAAGGANHLVFDSRFAESRRFAESAPAGFDCSEDMALLWFTTLVRQLPDLLPLAGLTTVADADVAAAFARDHGLKFAVLGSAGRFTNWRIDRVL